MQNKKIIFPLALLLLVISLLILSPKPAQASFLDDVVDGVKDFFTPDSKKEFTIDSDISLALGGDVDKDGQIDAGDIVRFKYKIKNTTDEEYSFATLKTGIYRNQLNFIHNIKGATGLTDSKGTVNFPNLRIRSQEAIIIGFDARVNYYEDSDKRLTTEPEFVTEDNKSVLKANKEEVVAKKILKEKFPSLIRTNRN